MAGFPVLPSEGSQRLASTGQLPCSPHLGGGATPLHFWPGTFRQPVRSGGQQCAREAVASIVRAAAERAVAPRCIDTRNVGVLVVGAMLQEPLAPVRGGYFLVARPRCPASLMREDHHCNMYRAHSDSRGDTVNILIMSLCCRRSGLRVGGEGRRDDPCRRSRVMRLLLLIN